MKKYFKNLDEYFYWNIILLFSWIVLHILAPPNTFNEVLLYLGILLICLFLLSTYVRFERISFDFFLNLIWRAKLNRLHVQYKKDFYYYDKHTTYDGDFYVYESELFQKYKITRVCTKFVNNKIHFCVECSRPGILIGRRGENINSLQKDLGFNIFIYETKDIWRNYKNVIF